MRVNEQIRLSPVRIIDENNEMLGVLNIADALAKAREAGLDLVEVAPNERPPVCRIMDYGKFKYKQSKKEHQARTHSHVSTMKELWMGPNTEEHDRQTKVRQAKAFLEDGDRVQMTVRFRGGQMRHVENGRELLKAVKNDLVDVAKVEREAKMEGRRMTILFVPIKAAAPKPKDKGEKSDKPKTDKPKPGLAGGLGAAPAISLAGAAPTGEGAPAAPATAPAPAPAPEPKAAPATASSTSE